MDHQRGDDIREAQNMLVNIQEISRLLNTGLSSEATAICIRLCGAGIDPEMLAYFIRTLQMDIGEYKLQGNKNSKECQL